MSDRQNVTVLGATGTIGLNTLDVIARHPQRFRAYALTAHSRHASLLEQCRRFEPVYAVMLDADAAECLRRELRQIGSATEVLCGVEALEQLQAFKPDVITLDVNMPEMDGLACLDRIMLERPCPVVISATDVIT